MQTTLNYITPAGLAALKSEYKELKEKERPQTVSAVAYAAALGDRSENADYQYNKKRLREIDRRLRFLQKRIEAAEIVDPKKTESDKILFGATVVVENEEGEERRYQIVGEDETAIDQGKISWKSPVAKALLGKSEGDLAVIRRPSGESEVEILKVEYI